MSMLGLLGAMVLLVAPGSWLAFGLRLPGYSVRARLALAVVLTPMVALAEFYALRSLGASFERTGPLLLLLNAPAVWLVVRRLRTVGRPDPRSVVHWLAYLALPAAYLWAWMHDVQVRANWGHSWTHADIVYQLANGALRPEEPLLAGVRLAYPWYTHVLQGMVSALAGGSPNANYLLTNLVWLGAVLVLVAEVIRLLGGSRAAQAWAVSWLCFGLNLVGTLAARVLPSGLLERYPVWGDARYSAWLRKFGLFEQTKFGIVLLAAMLLVALTALVEEERPLEPVLAGAVLLSVAVFYPILFPATAALAGAWALVASWRPAGGASRLRPWLVVTGLGVVSAAACVASLRLITVDHATGATLGLSTAWFIKVKAVTVLVVLAPLLAGMAAFVRLRWRPPQRTFWFLGLGTLASACLYVLFDIYYASNEYKYMFTAALCLVPFPVLVLDACRERWPRVGPAIGVAASALLAVPAILDVRAGVPKGRFGPVLDVSHFSLALAATEPLAGATRAIRDSSPITGVLVARTMPFDLVTLTRRTLFVPSRPGGLHGIGLKADYLLKSSRGYSAALVDERRRLVDSLFASTDSTTRHAALARIAGSMGRPVVVLASRAEDAELVAWMQQQGFARALHADDAWAAWTVEAVPPARARGVPAPADPARDR